MKPILGSVVILMTLLVTGCNTHHTIVIQQDKPLEINFNAHIELVVKDARQNLEQISGEKPTNIVRPEDIGLPSGPGSDAQPVEPMLRYDDQIPTIPVLYTHNHRRDEASRLVLIAAADDVKTSMKARHAKIQALWDEKLVGESHTGLLASKGKLSDEQSKLVAAENADRTALYGTDAKAKGEKIDDISLSYYLARLGYAKTGVWYEKYNPSSKQWEWKQWGS